MKIERHPQASTSIVFTLDDGRTIEMKLSGRESRSGVLGKDEWEKQQEVNRNDVADLLKKLQSEAETLSSFRSKQWR